MLPSTTASTIPPPEPPGAAPAGLVDDDREPSAPTLIAGILATGLGWSLLLPSGGFVLLAAPFVARHPSKLWAYPWTAYLVAPIIMGATLLRLGPRLGERKLGTGAGVATLSGLVALALAAVGTGAHHWFDHGLISDAPALRRHVEMMAALAFGTAVAVPLLLASPASRRDFASIARIRAGDPAWAARLALRAGAVVIPAMLISGVLALASRA